MGACTPVIGGVVGPSRRSCLAGCILGMKSEEDADDWERVYQDFRG